MNLRQIINQEIERLDLEIENHSTDDDLLGHNMYLMNQYAKECIQGNILNLYYNENPDEKPYF